MTSLAASGQQTPIVVIAVSRGPGRYLDAGAYVYGKSRHERVLDQEGKIKRRSRKLPQSQWAVLIHDHHEGYIDRATYDANQARIGTNIRPRPHQPGGAVREGAALLQGIATCGHCGRKLRTQYPGRNARPGYYCAGKNIVNGRGIYCLNIGGVQIDQAVADALLEAVDGELLNQAQFLAFSGFARMPGCGISSSFSFTCSSRLHDSPVLAVFVL